MGPRPSLTQLGKFSGSWTHLTPGCWTWCTRRSGGRAAYDGGLFAGGWQAESFNYEFELPRGTITQARLDNLVRLGLAFHPTANLGRLRVNEPPIDRKKIGLTELGAAFVATCRSPSHKTP
jgi:hypothetical protein